MLLNTKVDCIIKGMPHEQKGNRIHIYVVFQTPCYRVYIKVLGKLQSLLQNRRTPRKLRKRRKEEEAG